MLEQEIHRDRAAQLVAMDNRIHHDMRTRFVAVQGGDEVDPGISGPVRRDVGRRKLYLVRLLGHLGPSVGLGEDGYDTAQAADSQYLARISPCTNPRSGAARTAGEGSPIQATFNSSGAGEYAHRFTESATVLKLGDGRVVGRRGTYRGRTVDLGVCAALKMGDVTVAVASRRVQCADPAFLESLGIDITAFRAVVVKSRGHFRAGLDEFFDDSQISEVDAGALVSPILSRIRFARLPRPVYPLDPETTWTPPRG